MIKKRIFQYDEEDDDENEETDFKIDKFKT